jgi:hypothetical protein
LEALEDRTLPATYYAATASDLIADIKAANQHAGSNTIVLTAPTTSPYILTAVNNTTDGPTGLPVIKKGDNLTIVGNGDTIERSTASGTPAFRLFDVASGALLTLDTVTLQNGLEVGSGTSAEGGAIYNQGTLVLSGATVGNNEVEGSNGANATNVTKNGGAGQDAAGGGIWSSGALTLENGTLIQNNTALGGNGGNAYAQVSNHTSFGGNGGNASGAGVDVAGGTATLVGSTFSGNQAGGGQPGAGVVFFGNYINEGTGGNAYGGGVAIVGATVTMSADTLSGNTSQAGANAYAYGGGLDVAGGSATSVILSNSDVTGNSVYGFGGFGGGILVDSGGSVTLTNDHVTGNAATVDYGGGGGTAIGLDSTVYLDSPTVANTNSNTLDGSPNNFYGPYILLP